MTKTAWLHFKSLIQVHFCYFILFYAVTTLWSSSVVLLLGLTLTSSLLLIHFWCVFLILRKDLCFIFIHLVNWGRRQKLIATNSRKASLPSPKFETKTISYSFSLRKLGHFRHAFSMLQCFWSVIDKFSFSHIAFHTSSVPTMCKTASRQLVMRASWRLAELWSYTLSLIKWATCLAYSSDSVLSKVFAFLTLSPHFCSAPQVTISSKHTVPIGCTIWRPSFVLLDTFSCLKLCKLLSIWAGIISRSLFCLRYIHRTFLAYKSHVSY